MNLDTRARRAAEGVRASALGVDPMAQMIELKHEDKTRRRASAMAIVGTTVAVAAIGIGWIVVEQSGGANSAPAVPATTPSAAETAPAGDLEPGKTIGMHMSPQLVARAPDSWAIFQDDEYVNLGSPTGTMGIEVDGPVLKVFDQDRDKGMPIPAGGYVDWLREHPWLSVIDDRMVAVDGQQVPQLTMKVTDKASTISEDGNVIRLLGAAETAEPDGWPEFVPGTVVTQTVIEVDGKTMAITSFGAENEASQTELNTANDLVVSTMQLPD